MDSVSLSMRIDCGKSIVDYNHLQARTLLCWQEDSTAMRCLGCQQRFSFLFRGKHHCRNCGYIFCANCCSNKTSIPEFVKIPLPPRGYPIIKNQPVKTCNLCRHKLDQLEMLRSIIEVFNNCIEINIQDIRNMGQVCKLWHQYANYYLSQFRSIQYELSYRSLTRAEKRLLWTNRDFFPGHDIWLTQLFKSLDLFQEQHSKSVLLNLLDKHIQITTKCRKNCNNLMCTRRCQPGLSLESALLLCDRKILLPEVVQYALSTLNDLPVEKFVLYIPYLLEQGLKSALSQTFDFLVGKCQSSLVIANEVYWGIRIGLASSDPLINNKFRQLLLQWQSIVPLEYKRRVEAAERFTELLETYYTTKNLNVLLLALAKNFTLDYTCILPIAIEQDLKLNLDAVRLGNSNTSPLILEFKDKTDKLVQFLYKPDDVRPDQIVMSVIGTIDDILKGEISDLNIIQYNVRPTSIKGGFIEMVPNSETLESIYGQTGLTLWNYITEQNPNSTVQELRDKFMYSTAAYCAITFLLGVGDRHLHNMMITQSGILFHIDYGWILGRDPKPGFGCPSMRISNDIVDALGGQTSKNYERFKDLCANKIYNALRRHVNLIVSLLTTLITSEPTIQLGLTADEFYREINKRFVPGETYHQAEIQFHNCIDSSTTKNYRYYLVDAFHTSAQNGIINNLSQTINTTKNYIQGFLNLMTNDNN